MTLETEAVLDRRSLRRKVGFWRGLALLAGVVALGATASAYYDGYSEPRQIARVTVDGMITEDRAQLRMLKRIAASKNVDALLLSINSTGGTTSGGEALFEAIREVAKTKPVVAQFGTVAASAAYITGLAADHIVARGNTITGSVGVIFQWPEVSGLLDKFGVKMNEIKSGNLKAVPSMFEPVSPEGRKVTEELVADSQKWFLGLVTTRRGVATKAIPGLEQGRIFSGREALTYKLIDEIGGEDEAIRWLETKRAVKPKLKLVDWRPRADSQIGLFRWLGQATLGAFGLGQSTASMISTADSFRARLVLDGLVSVWQPAEK
jgi:protease IV